MLAKRWQEWVMLLAGAWFAIAPWALGFAAEVSATVLWATVLVGLAVVALSLGELVRPRVWEPVLNLLIGVWMIASPWVLLYSALRAATSNAVIVGAVLVVLAIWDGLAHFDMANRVRGGTGHAT